MNESISSLWYLTQEYLRRPNFDYQYAQDDGKSVIEITTHDYYTYEFDINPEEVLSAQYPISTEIILPYYDEIETHSAVIFPDGSYVGIHDMEITAHDIDLWLKYRFLGTINCN